MSFTYVEFLDYFHSKSYDFSSPKSYSSTSVPSGTYNLSNKHTYPMIINFIIMFIISICKQLMHFYYSSLVTFLLHRCQLSIMYKRLEFFVGADYRLECRISRK